MRYSLALGLMLATAACGSPKQSEPPTPEPVEIAFDGAGATDSAAILAHGKRLTTILGCNGCHEPDMRGELFTADEPEMGKIYAANLTREVPRYNDAQLEKLLREGVQIDGRDLWIMPSENYQNLSVGDMRALIAYLRTLEPAGERRPPPVLGPKAKSNIAEGKLMPAAAAVKKDRGVLPPDLGEGVALGRYISSTVCAICHGPELKGKEGLGPDLIAAGAYSQQEFRTLLRTGKPTGGRKLKLMAEVAKEHFAHFTDREIDALHAYLKARADQPQ